jgi:hypothetical protein
VRFAGAGVGGRGAIALEHLAGPPTGDPHEVGLVAAHAQPLVGEGVAELVGMQVRNAGLLPATLEQVADAVLGERAALAEPQRLQVGELVREARRVPAPEGTVTFTGQVATIRSQSGYMGHAELKMLVIAEAADGGGEFRVWCTVPRCDGPFGEGDRITLTAELRRSERDPSFVFGRRPRLAASGGGARQQRK